MAAEYTDITVELNILPDTVMGIRDAIAVWMLEGDGTVDIYGMDSPWVTEFGQAGWAVELSDEVPELSESFVDTGVEIFSYDGDPLGVPFWGSISGLYYQTYLLEEYGFDVPSTYDDLVDISDTILEDQPELTAFAWPGPRKRGLSWPLPISCTGSAEATTILTRPRRSKRSPL